MKTALVLVFLVPFLLWSQQGAPERIKVHGRSLEGNLSADPADGDVSVYLPPSYKKEAKRRYPVSTSCTASPIATEVVLG